MTRSNVEFGRQFEGPESSNFEFQSESGGPGDKKNSFSANGFADRRTTDGWAGVTPADLLRGVFSRLPSVVFVTLLVTALAVGILIVWPNHYSSDGLMYVRLGRAALSIDPTAQNSGSSGVSVQETRSAEVLSIAEMISSREIAERVVNEVGAETINEPRTWFDRAGMELQQFLPEKPVTPPKGMSVQQYNEQVQREAAIKKVRTWISISAPKNGYTVAVKANGPDAMLAQAIAQSVMDQYKRYHVEAHRSDGSMEFFEQQVGESKQAAVTAREQLQTARSESGWMSIESAETTLRDRIVNLEISLDEAESQYAESNQRALALKDQLTRTKEWIPTEITKGVANVAGDSMRTQLFDEQVQESEELATLKPTHPRFRLLQEKMTRSTEIAAGESDMRELTREAINPIWQQLESQYSLASAGAQGLKSKCESLRLSLQNTRRELLRLNHDAVNLAKLRWQADIAEETLKGHAKSLEESRIIFELDRKNMSDVTVIQDASLNLKKAGPPRSVLAVLGALIGLGFGVLQAVLRYTPPTPKTDSINMPVRSRPRKPSGLNGETSRLPEHDHRESAESENADEQQTPEAPMTAATSHEIRLPR